MNISFRKDQRPAIAGLLAATLLSLGASAVSGAGLNSGPWPMFHRSAAHEGRSPELFPESPTLLWSAPLSDSVEASSPAVDENGVIYLGDAGKELWAFDASGAPLWNYHTDGNLKRSSPAVADDGVIYFGSNDGNLYALNPDSSLQWASPTGGAVKTSPAIGLDGTIYAGSDDANLWAFLPDGSVKWTFPAGDTIRSSPALVADSLVVFGSNDGGIYAVHTSDGSLAWQAATGGPVKSSPAVGQGGVIFVGSFDGFLYALYAYGGLNWATFTGEEIRSSPAIGSTGKIYLGVGTEIHCYHDEGDPSWVFSTGDIVESSPAVVSNGVGGDIVICGSDDGNLYSIGPSGTEVWSHAIGSPVRSSPAVGANGVIYVGAMDGRLYAFGSGSSGVGDPMSAGPRLVFFPNPLPAGASLKIRLLGSQDDVPRPGILDVYDSSGRRLRSLALPVHGTATWDGTGARGEHVASGIYYFRWGEGDRSGSGRVVRVR
jgi:outer membrane protein assembly factor BamB